MLELRNITKDYVSGDTTVHALKGISLQFRDSEFVAILGQSGCGKTTLLNIIGGLDHYTSGDLVINGTSTKKYLDKDWDAYRNHDVGFVFQSYNLIPHQSVLSNVELALTLSGVSKRERRERASRALEQVGLGDQLHKKPNQMSGGQMQRVAIARALVNDPTIVLADEPTGALDSETSVQVMEILREVARDRLVVMVTHNPELAQQYATRIVRVKDGEVLDDSDPYEATPAERQALEDRAENTGVSHTSMSLATAFSLSLNNLMTKKGRTILTAFAGSIGIIGIALILSLSSGAQDYIKDMEESTMGSYPLTIQSTSMDMATMMTAMTGMHDDATSENDSGQVESKNIVTGLVSSLANGANKNDMASIKAWLDSNPDDIQSDVTDIQYAYKTPLNIYAADTSGGVVQVNPSTVMDAMGFSTSGATQSEMMSSMAATGSGYDVWTQLLNNAESLERDYSVVAGRMPESWNEVVLCLDENDRISDYTLYALGLKDQSELKSMMSDAMAGKKVEEPETQSYSYDELMGLEFKLVPESSKFEKGEDGLWSDMSDDEEFMASAVAAGDDIRVVGIVRPSEDNSSASVYGGVLYRSDLMQHLVDEVNASPVVAAQEADANTDIFTGYAFPEDDEESLTMEGVDELIAEMPQAQAEQVQAYIDQMRESGMSDDEIIAAFQKQMSRNTSDATYDGNLEKLGVADIDEPYTISIYPRDFEAKERVDQIIADYNDRMSDSGKDDQVIQYTDIVGAMMSSVTDIVNSITYILVAFVAISLVVSSIMIGIITYISVLERTKEIGILRSIGASKKDVSRVFNAETFIIGLVAGVLGIGITVVLDIPINMIIEMVAGVKDMAAVPAGAGAVLVLISVLLTLIGGLIPSKMAANKDPVMALRTE